MRPRKVLTILGTRPEAIKLAPMIRKLEERPDCFTSVVCATAQHRQMLDQALELFELKPDIDLDIMAAGQSLGELTSEAVRKLDQVIAKERPDVVLVSSGRYNDDLLRSSCGFLSQGAGRPC